MASSIPRPQARHRSGLSRLGDLFSYPRPVDDYIALVNRRWRADRAEARVVALVDETEDARSIVLRPPPGFTRYQPGQYIQVGAFIDGRLQTRTYSLTSVPGSRDGLISITVKAIPAGLVSGFLVRELRVGDMLRVSAPDGAFVRQAGQAQQPTLFITGGSGITPVMAMLRAQAAGGEPGDIVHLYYAMRPEDMIFGAELQALARRQPGYRLVPLYTRAAAQPAERFNQAQLQRLCPDWRDRNTWGCGPAPLLDALEAHWQDAGLGEQLRLERFQAQLAVPASDDTGGTVRFSRSERSTGTRPGEPLLAVAEGLGLNPASGCRMGICHSCDCTLQRGRVRDLRSGRLIDQPGARIQPCISAAVGAVELEL